MSEELHWTVCKRIRSFGYRLLWYVSLKPCWAHNDTCVHCNTFMKCRLKRPSLLRVNGKWCCGSYGWDLFKVFQKINKGTKVCITVDNVAALAKEEDVKADGQD